MADKNGKLDLSKVTTVRGTAPLRESTQVETEAGARAFPEDPNSLLSRLQRQEADLGRQEKMLAELYARLGELRAGVNTASQVSPSLTLDRASGEVDSDEARGGARPKKIVKKQEKEIGPSLSGGPSEGWISHAESISQTSRVRKKSVELENELPGYLEKEIKNLPELNISSADSIVNYLVNVARILEFAPRALKEILTRSCLNAKASSAQVIRNLLRTSSLSWINFKRILLEHMSPRDRLKLTYERLYTFQGTYETLREFVDRVVSVGEILDFPEEDLIEVVLTGVSTDVRAHFSFKEVPVSYADLYALVMEIEKAIGDRQNMFGNRNLRESRVQERWVMEPYDPYEEQYGNKKINYNDRKKQPRQNFPGKQGYEKKKYSNRNYDQRDFQKRQTFDRGNFKNENGRNRYQSDNYRYRNRKYGNSQDNDNYNSNYRQRYRDYDQRRQSPQGIYNRQRFSNFNEPRQAPRYNRNDSQRYYPPREEKQFNDSRRTNVNYDDDRGLYSVRETGKYDVLPVLPKGFKWNIIPDSYNKNVSKNGKGPRERGRTQNLVTQEENEE